MKLIPARREVAGHLTSASITEAAPLKHLGLAWALVRGDASASITEAAPLKHEE